MHCLSLAGLWLGAWRGELPGFPAEDHWAFQAPHRPSAAREPSEHESPIDALLGQVHDERGLSPVEAAPDHVLLRRLTLDLTGLPPAREELRAFAEDPSPDAYDRAVDRLLASPRYGERWGRHWMDVWRYSDWYGRRAVPDVMNSYAQIWRWRDWIVQSLNEDKGYDRMVSEMLAADEIAPEDDVALPATGFLVRSWYKWNYNSWMKDLVEHTGKAFLGLTLNCAHCHDHKYDPISQDDYFRFRAFFEPIELRHDPVRGLPDPGPFRKYVYTESYGPISTGMIRVFDEKLDAETHPHALGDSRNRIEGKPPALPGVPAALTWQPVEITPVELPPRAYYPGLKDFVQEESIAAAQKALAGEPQSARAKLELEFALARVAADRARHGIAKASAEERVQLARAAARAERLLKLEVAEELAVKAAAALARAEKAGETDAKAREGVPKARETLEQARNAVEEAKRALESSGVDYTPLTPIYPLRSTGRRRALAEWITSPRNPLAARVSVNHIWLRHFGAPLVESVSDFGRNGKRPWCPELLDWLAVELVESGWSQKRLHRSILTSRAYRRASTWGPAHARSAELDPENRYLWRRDPIRLEAEAVRDGILFAAGDLDARLGGPEIDHKEGLTTCRRSLYYSHHGEGRMQFLEVFDAANPCDAYRRTSSIVPQQALALANSELATSHSRSLARRLWEETQSTPHGSAPACFVEAAFEAVLGRPPSRQELELTLEYVAPRGSVNGSAPRGPDVRARESFVQALFNHNDYVTVR